MESFKEKLENIKKHELLNKYVDMSIWNRINYVEPKKIGELVRDTGIISLAIGVCVLCVTGSVSKVFVWIGI
jgi:hypothetical protein